MSGGLDLNKPLDFARATQSLAGNTLLRAQDLLNKTRGIRQWVIKESAYGHPPKGPISENGGDAGSEYAGLVKFHIFKSPVDYQGAVDTVSDSSGRRNAIYEFPYVDGQAIDDMGRKGYSFEFNIIIHGPGYKAAYEQFLVELADPTPGILIHPIKGRIKVKPADWTETHKSDQRQAVQMKVTFIESSFSIGDLDIEDEKTVGTKSAITSALAFIKKIGDIIDKVRATVGIVQSFVNGFTTDLTAAQDALKSNLQSINASFNTGDSVDIPGAVPPSSGGSTGSGPVSGGLSGSVNVVSPADPLADLRTTTKIPPATPKQIVDNVNLYRNQIEARIKDLHDEDLELEFFDDIVTLQESAISLQLAAEAAIRSSQPRVIDYVLPREMSIREVAFFNDVPLDQVDQIQNLNPQILSVNSIDKGSTLQIPRFTT